MSPLTLEMTVTGPTSDVDVLTGALGPEHRDEFPGVEATLTQGNEGATLTITGEHVPSMRAAANAYLRWIRTIEDVLAVDPDPDASKVNTHGRR